MAAKATISEANGSKSYSVSLVGWEGVVKSFTDTADEITKKEVTLSLATVGLGMLRKRVPQGISYEGRKFADYSTVPMYHSRAHGFGRLKAIGKEYGSVTTRGKDRKLKSGKIKKGKLKTVARTKGRTVFASTGLPHKSMYLPGGYAQLRLEMGRSYTEGRLVFSGKMLNNMTVAVAGENASKIYFPSIEQRAKAAGNQTRYKFFGLTEGESNVIAEKYFNLITAAMGEK